MTFTSTDTALDLLEQWLSYWSLGADLRRVPKGLRDRTYIYVKTHQPGYEIDEDDIEAGVRAMLNYENAVGINECPRQRDDLTPAEEGEYGGYAEAVLRSRVIS